MDKTQHHKLSTCHSVPAQIHIACFCERKAITRNWGEKRGVMIGLEQQANGGPKFPWGTTPSPVPLDEEGFEEQYDILRLNYI